MTLQFNVFYRRNVRIPVVLGAWRFADVSPPQSTEDLQINKRYGPYLIAVKKSNVKSHAKRTDFPSLRTEKSTNT